MLCDVNEVLPIQNVPKLYEQETAQQGQYCEKPAVEISLADKGKAHLI